MCRDLYEEKLLFAQIHILTSHSDQLKLPKCNIFFVFELKNKNNLIFNNGDMCLIERLFFTELSLGRKNLFMACVGNEQFIAEVGGSEL